MQFKKIEFSDKEIIRKYYTPEKSVAAHFSFTNMYIWQESYNIEYAVESDCLCIKSRHSGKNSYFVLPCGHGDRKAATDKIIEYAASMGQKCVFAQLSNDDCDFLKENYGERFSFLEDRNNWEYVYETESLISLSGKKLHGKRNHLNVFLKDYDWKYEKINEENIAIAREFAISSIIDKEDRDEELLSANKLFDKFFEFPLTGAVLYANGEICAVTAGEMLSDNTAVIHLEKANPDIRGSFAAINNLFAKNEFSHVKYINREEDMGIEGLRRAKTSYRPCHMAEKYVGVEVK